MSRSFSRNQTMTSCIIYFIYICIYIYNHISISTSKLVMVRCVKLLLHSNRHGEVRLTPAYSPPVLFGLTTFQYFNISKPTIYHISIDHLNFGESNVNNMSHVNFHDVHDTPLGFPQRGNPMNPMTPEAINQYNPWIFHEYFIIFIYVYINVFHSSGNNITHICNITNLYEIYDSHIPSFTNNNSLTCNMLCGDVSG